MKLSEHRKLDLLDAINAVATAIEPDIEARQSNIYSALKNLTDLSIAIGLEIAMSHKHVIGAYEGGIEHFSGLARAIDHD